MRRRFDLAVVALSGVMLGSALTLLVVQVWGSAPGVRRPLIVAGLLVTALAILVVWVLLVRKLAGEEESDETSGLRFDSRTLPTEFERGKAQPAAPALPPPTISRPSPSPQRGSAQAGRREDRSGWISGPRDEEGPAFVAEERQAKLPSPDPPFDRGEASPSESSSGSSALRPSQLVEVWDIYQREGGGGFNAGGLSRQLEKAGLSAEVLPGDRFRAGDLVLGVDPRDSSGVIYLLPNFGKPPRLLDAWFRLSAGDSRFARIQRLLRPAVVRRKGGELVVDSKGEIE